MEASKLSCCQLGGGVQDHPFQWYLLPLLTDEETEAQEASAQLSFTGLSSPGPDSNNTSSDPRDGPPSLLHTTSPFTPGVTQPQA